MKSLVLKPTLWQRFLADAEPKPSEVPLFLKWFLDSDFSLGVDSRAGAQKSPCALFFNDQYFFWAMRNLPAAEAVKHMAICGTPGSGKTTATKLLLQSIAPRFQIDRPKAEQLIVFDAKGDMIPILAGLGLGPDQPHVYLLNPADARSAIWNVAETVQSPMMARHLAGLLVPEEKNSTAPYFTDGARQIIYTVIMGLNAAAGHRWSLRDLLCALDSREHIERVSRREPRAGILAARILDDKRHSPGVISTLGTKMGDFEQVADLWHNRQRARVFSIQEFLQKPGVLILSNDPVLRESLWPINAILLKALTAEILRGEETLEPRHWFVLDEFPAMRNVECVHDLLNYGRSKGAAVLLGTHSVERLAKVYGDNDANDILSMCATKMFLHAGGPQTSEWIERHFGKTRRTEVVTTQTWGSSGSSTSYQYGLQDRPLFLSTYFADLPLPVADREYIAVSDVPCLGRVIITKRPFNDLLDWCRPKADIPGVVRIEQRENHMLEPWTKEEEEFFCGPDLGPGNGELAGEPDKPKKKIKLTTRSRERGTQN